MKKFSSKDQNIPDKLYFKIGEVSGITGLPSYVLRFWETEFSCIRPKRTASGQRLYRRSDVEMILRIRHLLHERKFTIQGAKQVVGTKKWGGENGVPASNLDEIRSELRGILDIMNENDGNQRKS